MRGDKTERILAAYRELAGGGRLPMVSEVAKCAGATVTWAADILKKNGLECRGVPRGKSEKRALNQKVIDDAFIRDYRKLADHHGRPPTLLEISVATGRTVGGSLAKTLKRLNLDYTLQGCGRKKAAEPEKDEKRKESGPPPEQQFALHRAVSSIEKILTIMESGNPEQRPETLPRAGEAYGVQDRIWLDCPVCGRRRLISPRMHPWWLRNRAGEAIFVCRDACTGRTV